MRSVVFGVAIAASLASIQGFAATTNDEVDTLKASVERQDPESMVQLGLKFAKGDGVSKDYTKAASLFRKAADKGSTSGSFWLGVLFANGNGVPQDFAKAASYYRVAADKGHAVAASNLGLLYKEGKGVAKDYAQAAALFRQSAAQGNSLGEYNLGSLYQGGLGVEKDDGQAVDLFRKSALQSNPVALFSLGTMYQLGRGVDANLVLALAYYEAAANLGLPTSGNAARAIRPLLKEAQAAEAHSFIARWTAGSLMPTTTESWRAIGASSDNLASKSGPGPVQKRFSGHYRASPIRSFCVSIDGDSVMLQTDLSPRAKFNDAGYGAYVESDGPRRMTFIADVAGVVTGALVTDANGTSYGRKLDQMDEGALQRRIESGKPLPTSEDVLRSTIEQRQKGMVDYEKVVPELATLAENSRDAVRQELAAVGALRRLQFKRVDEFGHDVYLAAFDHGTLEWSIGLTADGMINFMTHHKPG